MTGEQFEKLYAESKKQTAILKIGIEKCAELLARIDADPKEKDLAARQVIAGLNETFKDLAKKLDKDSPY